MIYFYGGGVHNTAAGDSNPPIRTGIEYFWNSQISPSVVPLILTVVMILIDALLSCINMALKCNSQSTSRAQVPGVAVAC